MITEYDTFKGKKDGVSIIYRIDSSIESECNFKNGQMNGICTAYYKNGNKSLEQEFLENNYNGTRKAYYKDGSIFVVQTFKNDKLDGLSKYYDRKGRLFLVEYYEQGKLNRQKSDEYSKIYDEYDYEPLDSEIVKCRNNKALEDVISNYRIKLNVYRAWSTEYLLAKEEIENEFKRQGITYDEYIQNAKSVCYSKNRNEAF